jgi:hypothetical protein
MLLAVWKTIERYQVNHFFCHARKHLQWFTIHIRAAAVFKEALQDLWPYGVEFRLPAVHENPADSLSASYPEVNPCVAHTVYRICKTVRALKSNGDNLKGNTKKTLVPIASKNINLQKQSSRQIIPKTLVIIRRWPSFDATMYFAEN